MVKMSRSNQQIQIVVVVLATVMTASWGHLLDVDGYHNWRYNLPHGPHPLDGPPFHHLPPLRSPLPPLTLHPPSHVIMVPVHVRGTFPPFIERIVQRIQTWWSIYNPPEFLTRPPPTKDQPDTTTPNSAKKKPTPVPSTTAPPEQESGTEATTEAPEVETTTSTPETSDSSVSTLAVFEVTPSASATSDETEEPTYITPERASLLVGQKEAYLRFLQTGTLPPYLESDIINETNG